MSALYLAIRVNSFESRRVPLSNINLNGKAYELKQSASQEVQLPPEELVLVYCGNILDDDSTLANCGVQPGVTVNVLKKIRKAPETITKPNLESDVALVAAFKNAAKNPNYRAALQRLSRPEVLENIMAATPGLREDPVALAMIQDPELLSQLISIQTVRRVMEAHPALADAAHYIVALVHEEAASTSSQAPSTSYSYSFGPLSDDDDDMESSQSSDSQPQTRDSSFNSSITSSQLAAALAAAQAMTNQTSQPSDASPSIPGLITSEMFSQALGQAFAASTAGSPSTQGQSSQPTPSTRTNLTDLEATSRRLSEHLQQMRELGLRDDTLNLQALQATDWNVAEAINLVFSGVMSDINDPDDSLE